MAKTNAERQRDYRARRALASTFGDSRLNLWIDGRASNALARLAAHHGLTRRAMIERLLGEADQTVQAGILPGSEAWSRYFAARQRSAAGPQSAGPHSAGQRARRG